MERRLNEAALMAVQRSVARQQPVTEELARASERSPFDEAMLVRHEHLLDVVRMVQEIDTQRREPDMHDVALFGADAKHERKRIAAGVRKAAEERAAFRAGR
jgi:hypothetical protein